MARFWATRLTSIAIVILLAFVIGQYVDATMASGPANIVRRIIYLCSLYGILSVSLNLINGITGQFSIGHAAFYQIGAYTAGFLSRGVFTHWGLQGPLLLLASTVTGALMAAVGGWIVGMPSLRLKGDYLAIATLGFGEIVRIFAINQDWLGGAYGMSGIPAVTKLSYLLMLVALTIAICRNLLLSVHGKAFLSIREDEMAADAMGVNTARYKIWAFVIGAGMAGAAGAMYAHFETYIGPTSFFMDVSFIVLAMVVVGGTGSITGSLVSAVLLIVLQEKLRDLGSITAGPLYLVALLLFIGAYVAAGLCRRFRPKPLGATGIWGGTILFALVAGNLIGQRLEVISTFSQTFEAYQLRMVIFSITLIVIMIVRPQGMFGHHEFSWQLFARKRRPALP